MKKLTFTALSLLWLALPYQLSAQTPTTTNIDINNIDATISSSSDLFWDFSMPGFEVPKGGGIHSIFSGGLWIGGLDNSGNLHMSAQTYRQTGWDFQPGPIDTILNQPTNPNLWNTSWKVDQSDVADHIQQVGTVGYVVPSSIALWPGYNAALGRVLAPFADVNSNGLYDPQNGDYPYFPGDQVVYSIFNDFGPHTESGCDTLGIEVHRTMYAFDQPSNPALNNTIFSRYEIKNYSNVDYQDLYITLWTDVDLGNYNDDYIGTDINLNMAYGYNGDADDTPGYGLNPPAVGIHFLNATMSSSLVYDNISGAPNGNPSNCTDYYKFTQAIWANNAPMTYGGNGQIPGNPVTTYMYSGDTDPVNFPALGSWTEATASNPPGDRRVINSIGPISLPAHGYYTFDAAYTWSQASSGGPLASLAQLQSDVSQLRIMYDNGLLSSSPMQNISQENLTVFPNPAKDVITIQNPKPGAILDLVITDITGKTVIHKSYETGPNIQVSVSGLQRGVYFVSMRQSNEIKRTKIVLQ